MKRTCNNCQAWFQIGDCEPSCRLGYPTKSTSCLYRGNFGEAYIWKMKPLVECPKPLGYMDMIKNRENYEYREDSLK